MQKSRLLLTVLSVAAAVLVLAVLLAQQHGRTVQQNSLLQSSSSEQQLQQLYDIPNFVYQRTQMHFPQAEENWLNQAAEGKIGDDVKPEPILNKLNDIIADARTHALTENYEARVNAKKKALEDNYATYDVQKGKVVHKIYGKQVGGSTTLRQMNMPARLRSVPTELRARRSSSTTQQLSQVSPPKFQATATKPYAVKVPPGLHTGQQFIAEIPNVGRMLVVVPPKVSGGELVSIQVPLGSKSFAESTEGKPSAVVSPSGPPKIHDHKMRSRDQQMSSVNPGPGMDSDEAVDGRTYSGSEHPNAAKMLDSALNDHYSASRRIRRSPVVTGADRQFVNPGSEHPVAAGMLDQALNNHYHSTPHNVFGLEH